MIKWKKIKKALPGTIDTAIYRSLDGRWELSKQFYAQGPTLFTWVLTRIDNPEFVAEFGTKQQATAFVLEQSR